MASGTFQTFKVVSEDSIQIVFEIAFNSHTRRLIEILNGDNAFGFLYLPGCESVRITIDVGQMDKSRIKYAPNSEFAVELSKFHFVQESIDILTEIRVSRSGKPACRNAGRINTEFSFQTLYDWIRNARVRYTKSSSIMNKRKERREVEEIQHLNHELSTLKEEKRNLIQEMNFYETELAKSGCFYFP